MGTECCSSYDWKLPAQETNGPIGIFPVSTLLIRSFPMNSQENPQFWHYEVRKNPPLFESSCLVCNAFVAASESQLNLALVELLHALKCRKPVE